jgi:hypothetical protein
MTIAYVQVVEGSLVALDVDSKKYVERNKRKMYTFAPFIQIVIWSMGGIIL